MKTVDLEVCLLYHLFIMLLIALKKNFLFMTQETCACQRKEILSLQHQLTAKKDELRVSSDCSFNHLILLFNTFVFERMYQQTSLFPLYITAMYSSLASLLILQQANLTATTMASKFEEQKIIIEELKNHLVEGEKLLKKQHNAILVG